MRRFPVPAAGRSALAGRADVSSAQGKNLTVVLRNRLYAAGVSLFCLAVLPGAAFGAAGPRAVEPVYQSWSGSETLKKGVEFWSRGNMEKALEAFAAATRLLPCDPVAWHNLGVALAHFGRHWEAIEAFSRERFFRPGSPCVFYCMGLSYAALGRLEDAENFLVLAVAGAPLEWQYWEGLAGVLNLTGKEEDAKTAFRNAARLKPRRARTGIRGPMDLRSKAFAGFAPTLG